MFRAEPHPFLIEPKGHFDASTAPTSPPRKGAKAKQWKEKLDVERTALGAWQHKLYADGRYSVLLIFQALDAGGKDGAIRHVFKGVNPTGLHVTSFKQPSDLELKHDFLWRTTQHLPARGHIAVFNRSYYEEVLVVRVHPELLEAQRLPETGSKHPWQERYRAIVEHERHLAKQGTLILKFWLNVSKEEQRRRFLERVEQPRKYWKFSAGDLRERAHWDDYMKAYGKCLSATSRPWAPWYTIPADDKDYSRWQVAALINAAIEKLDIDFPEPSQAQLLELADAATRLAQD